jgi:hypothetical protein
MGGKNAKKMDGSEGFRWEEVGDDESVGLVLVVAFQVTQQLKFNFMHLYFDLGVKDFQRALLAASIHTSRRVNI